MTETPLYVASAFHEIAVGGGVKRVEAGDIVTLGDEPYAYPPDNFAEAFPGFSTESLPYRADYEPLAGPAQAYQAGEGA